MIIVLESRCIVCRNKAVVDGVYTCNGESYKYFLCKKHQYDNVDAIVEEKYCGSKRS